MLRISISTLLALGLSGGAHAGDAESILPIFQENCIQCHSKKGKVKGKVNLLEISDASALTADPKLLRKIVEAIDFEEMPPEDGAPAGSGASCDVPEGPERVASPIGEGLGRIPSSSDQENESLPI